MITNKKQLVYLNFGVTRSTMDKWVEMSQDGYLTFTSNELGLGVAYKGCISFSLSFKKEDTQVNDSWVKQLRSFRDKNNQLGIKTMLKGAEWLEACFKLTDYYDLLGLRTNTQLLHIEENGDQVLVWVNLSFSGTLTFGKNE